MTRRSLCALGLLLAPVLWLAACSDTQGSDACSRDSQCPPDYRCRGGLCLLACSDTTDCPPGESCQVGVCQPGLADVVEATEADLADVVEEPEAPPAPLGVGPDGQPIFGQPVGGACAEETDCRPGLTCAESACEPAGETADGGLCTVSGECAEGLACGLDARCTTGGGAAEGEVCSPVAPEVCGPGLRCQAFGLGGACVPEGQGDLGSDCSADADCLAPLVCSAEAVCTIPLLGGVTLYPGAECGPERESPFRAYFEVPAPGEPLSEFFRLPWPSDVRRGPEGIDMDGFPRPEPGVLGANAINATVDAVAADGSGFSPTPSVVFRFSDDYDFSKITILGDSPTLRWVNIDDPESPHYGRGPTSIGWFQNNGRSRWLCDNSLLVRASWHQPLAHGETYAVYLTTDALSAGGDTPVQDDDLVAVLDDTRPDDARLGPAWDAFAKFRDYLSREAIDPGTIASAAVFTTMVPERVVPRIREAVRARLVTPSLDDLVLCGQDVTSPCDDGGARVCLNLDEGYLELHAVYRSPRYQVGTRPYLTPADGGGLELDENGRPVSQGTEPLCLGITLPLGDMPEAGWPVVLFAHGTGGDFLSHLRNGVAAELSEIDLGSGDPVRFATIGLDGVMHGPRRGESTLDPEVLFYNVENPVAAVGNVYQGAADYFSLTHLLEVLDVSADRSPTGAEIRFDTDNVYFFGHSQGATVGAPFVAFEPDVRAAVFSGAGGGLILSLLNKQSPVPVAQAVALVLNEGTGQLRDSHPVLGLLQQVIDPVDAMHYGPLFFQDVPEGGRAHHLFVTYGLGDTYTPDPTIEVFGSQSGVEMALPTLRAVGAIPGTALPATGNRTTETGDVTALMVTYQPAEGEDGHFVAFRDARAIAQIREFLATAVRSGVPTVSEAE